MKLFKEKFFSLEMGFSRKEFIALLGSQNKLVYQRDGNVITFNLSEQQAVIMLGKEDVRRIGSAILPKLDVNFNFSKMSDDKQGQFMKIFLLKFHRGGG
jgi:hypothetical protein